MGSGRVAVWDHCGLAAPVRWTSARCPGMTKTRAVERQRGVRHARTHEARTNVRDNSWNSPRFPARQIQHDLGFAYYGDNRERIRYGAKRTANAVGVYAPPGFKSPILR
jgi:hypothetical protein